MEQDKHTRSSGRIKIGLFLDALPFTGGTFQYNQTILEAVAALPTDRYDVVAGYTSELWLEQLKSHPIRSVAIKYGFSGRVIGILLNLLNLPISFCHKITPPLQSTVRALLREQCDLWIFPSQDVLSYQAPVPGLVTILDLAHRYEKRFTESASKSEYLIRERTFSNICRWADGVLVQTELGQQQVVNAYGIAADKIHILPLVAPKHIYTTLPPAGFDDRYRLPVKYLFYPAQFWEHKNHRNLLAAMARLKTELPDLKLVLAGSKKNAYDAVVSMVRELQLGEDVLFLGYVPDEDMPELYRRARALVMPTYFGPSNIPPLEASVVGCPVAISNVSSMPEQLGDSALVFDPDSVDEIAACIRRLWTDDQLCSRLVETGKQQMARWGQQEFNARLEQIIGQVVGNQRGAKAMNCHAVDSNREMGDNCTRGATRENLPGSPLVSVVTVVKNGAPHLMECMESVFAQSWPNVEYIVIDGGSTDSTLDIIRSFEDRIDYWVSEPDRGIFDAMNKGLAIANGELIGLLNADDWYEPGALEAAATAYLEKGVPGIYYGDKHLVQVDMGKVYEMPASLEFWRGMTICHQAMFVHREVYQRLGGYDLQYRLAADFDFFVRAVRGKIPFIRLRKFVVNFRDSGASAQALGEGNREISSILKKTFGAISTIYIRNRLLTGYNLAAVAGGRLIGRLLGERALHLFRIPFYRLFTRRGGVVKR